MVKIYISGDHAGFKLKSKILRWLESDGYEVEDLGPYKYDKKDDYPDYTFPLAERVSKERKSCGVIIAGSGIGECIASNKVKRVRAVLYHGKSEKLIRISKLHDNTNVLCLGSWFVTEREAKRIIKLWITTEFSGEERHKRRLAKISKYER